MPVTINKKQATPRSSNPKLMQQLSMPLENPDQSSLNKINEQFALSSKQTTGIEWTNHTWNPFVGCSVHTAGCTNCYAMNQAANIGADHYVGTVKLVNGNAVWTGKLNLAPPHIMNKPKKIQGNAMIFVNSMSDFFHEAAMLEWQLAALDVMKATPQHTYQILTKRPENIQKLVDVIGKFPDNIMLGITMEREDYRHRIDLLRQAPAKIRFMSIEPLVGSAGDMNLDGIHWVIVGGESGFKARPMKADWVREVRDQCIAQDVPFFLKQWGIPQNNPLFTGNKAELAKLDPVGKGGSLLDGVLWKQFPKV